MRNAQAPTIHLAHPYPIPSDAIFEVFSEELSLPLLPYADWVKNLDAASKDAFANDNNWSAEITSRIPATTIIEFFHRGLKSESDALKNNDTDYEIMGIPRLQMKQALQWSKVLGDARRINADDVRLWLANWKEISFLP